MKTLTYSTVTLKCTSVDKQNNTTKVLTIVKHRKINSEKV